MTCRLIINADDLGWSEGVNEAICALHDEGIVTSTSLMVGGPAAAGAVARLRQRPGLAVGLHLALVDAPATLPREELPHLVDSLGWLPKNCIRAAARCTLLPACREQTRREIEAQFRAFAGLQLGWSHVDSHMHYTLTPCVFRMVLECCRRYPVLGFRVPQDDYRLYRRLDPSRARKQALTAAYFRLLCGSQRGLLRRAGFRVPDRSYGFFRTGHLEFTYLTRLVERLPDGCLELHCHPDLSSPAGRTEFEALRSKEFRSALQRRGVVLSSYASLPGGPGRPEAL